MFKFYDDYEQLLKEFKKHNIDGKNIIEKHLELKLPIRSFSRPFMPGNGCIFELKQGVSKDIINMSNDICLAYSEKEIFAILNDMPIIKWYCGMNKGTLKNVAIIWRNHFLEENVGLLNGFLEMGVLPEDIIAFDKGDSTKHHIEIWKTFEKMGFTVDLLDNASFTDKKEIEIAKNKILNFINKRKDKKIIVLDDGAIISTILNDIKIDNVIGILELTEMGLRRIRNLETEPLYPILNIAKTSLKRNITYPEIANSIFLRIIELLGAEKIVGRKVILCGYGDMGEILADRLQKYGVHVIIHDPDIMKLIIASEQGFQTYKDIEEATKKENPFMIIGASGYRSITKSVIESLDNNTYVTAGATADLLVFEELEKEGKLKKESISNIGTHYLINDKKITVLGNGRSVNLFNSEAIPNKSNDVFKASMLVASVKLITGNQKIAKDICLEEVENWIRESGILNKYYDLYLK